MDRSMYGGQSNMTKSRILGRSTKKKKIPKGPDIDIQNVNAVKKAFFEPIEERVKAFELPADKLYYQILQQDFMTNVKCALHWSGADVLDIRIVPIKRTNKIRSKLSNESQNKYIYLAGVIGFIKVRHRELENFARSRFIENFLTMAVIANTVVLALDGMFYDQTSLSTLETINDVLTNLFISEMALKIVAFTPFGYLRDKMNCFDGTIVMLSILEMTLFAGSGGKAISAFRAVRIFRTFRVLKVTRLLRSLRFMKVIIQVLSTTMENFVYICFLMFLFVIIYALLGMQLYGGNINFRNNHYRQNFDSFFYAFLAVFQILSLENWNDIMVITMQTDVNKFLTALYLISWIFIGNWVFLNLFLAILMDGFTMQLENNEEEDEKKTEDQRFLQIVHDALLEANPDLKEQFKENEYKLQKQQSEQIELNTPNPSLNNSLVEDDIEIDIVNHTTRNKRPLFHGIECNDSLYIFSKRNIIRQYCYRIVEHSQFENLILFFIVTSSLKLAVDTYLQDNEEALNVSAQIDVFFNLVFAVEATIKIISFGFFMDDNSYLRESWSQLDFFIVSSSLIDMSLTSIDLPFIKILRLLRTLRPLRFISHNVNMKMVVIALLESLGGMVNVIIVVTMIWLMFAILGISLLGSRLQYCSFPKYPNYPPYGINQDACLHNDTYKQMGGQWVNMFPNFDNIINAMITLYIVSTLENWPNIMYPMLDSDYAAYGPSKDNVDGFAVYFIVYILIGSFFLINLFVGVICFYFEQASKNEKKRGNIFLTQDQENWIEIQRMTVGVSPEFKAHQRPTNKIRGIVFDIVQHKYFDPFIMFCIVCNILTMAMTYEGSNNDYNKVLDNLNLGFTSVFIAETSFKIISYGFSGFWSSGWNQFDLFVVISSLVDLTLNALGGSSISFLRVGPQLMRIVRVLRVTRLLKLVKSMRGLQKLILTLIYSLPSLLNIGTLLLLVYFIFSVLGVFMFRNAPQGDQLTPFNNFETFGTAMLTLFRASTGENWEYIMNDVSPQSPMFAPIYFILFYTISAQVMLQLFVLIIIQYFENYNLKEDNPLDQFQENLEIFREYWSKYTKNTKGERMHQKHILFFFTDMPAPLGFGSRIKKQTIAKEVMNMQLIGDGLGNVFFNELLYASMRRAFGNRIFKKAQKDLNLELQQILSRAEQETRRIIERNKNQELKRRKSKFLPNLNNPINPLVTYLFNRTAFLSWRKYAQIKVVEDGDTPGTEYEEETDPSENSQVEGREDFIDENDENFDEDDDQNSQNSDDEFHSEIHRSPSNAIEEEDEEISPRTHIKSYERQLVDNQPLNSVNTPDAKLNPIVFDEYSDHGSEFSKQIE